MVLLAGACSKSANGGGEPAGQVTSASTPVDTGDSPAAQNDSVGTVFTTFRGTKGTDHVSCNAIDTELLISPNGGRIRWTATASDSSTDSYPFVGAPLPSVVLDPASGVLDPGQSQLLHISGAFDGGPGATFYVAVTAPNSSGYSNNTLQLFCQ
jgi:hypothetical protein